MFENGKRVQVLGHGRETKDSAAEQTDPPEVICAENIWLAPRTALRELRRERSEVWREELGVSFERPLSKVVLYCLAVTSLGSMILIIGAVLKFAALAQVGAILFAFSLFPTSIAELAYIVISVKPIWRRLNGKIREDDVFANVESKAISNISQYPKWTLQPVADKLDRDYVNAKRFVRFIAGTAPVAVISQSLKVPVITVQISGIGTYLLQHPGNIVLLLLIYAFAIFLGVSRQGALQRDIDVWSAATSKAERP